MKFEDLISNGYWCYIRNTFNKEFLKSGHLVEIDQELEDKKTDKHSKRKEQSSTASCTWKLVLIVYNLS